MNIPNKDFLINTSESVPNNIINKENLINNIKDCNSVYNMKKIIEFWIINIYDKSSEIDKIEKQIKFNTIFKNLNKHQQKIYSSYIRYINYNLNNEEQKIKKYFNDLNYIDKLKFVINIRKKSYLKKYFYLNINPALKRKTYYLTLNNKKKEIMKLKQRISYRLLDINIKRERRKKKIQKAIIKYGINFIRNQRNNIRKAWYKKLSNQTKLNMYIRKINNKYIK